jgi:hypothetical protein
VAVEKALNRKVREENPQRTQREPKSVEFDFLCAIRGFSRELCG